MTNQPTQTESIINTDIKHHQLTHRYKIEVNNDRNDGETFYILIMIMHSHADIR